MLRMWVLIPAILVAACGVPEDEHNALKKDLENYKQRLGTTQDSLSEITKERNKLKSDLSAMGGEKDQLARRLGATKAELAELRRARAAAEARSKTFRELVRRLKAMIDSGKLRVQVRKGRMIVQLADKILFDPGKTKLKEGGKNALQELARVLRDIGDRDFLVAGHTDNVPIRTRRFRSNWELSAARAVQVVKFLQQQGVDPKHLGASGFSEYDPVGDNSTDTGRRSNRRIEIILMPKISELPKIDS